MQQVLGWRIQLVGMSGLSFSEPFATVYSFEMKAVQGRLHVFVLQSLSVDFAFTGSDHCEL